MGNPSDNAQPVDLNTLVAQLRQLSDTERAVVYAQSLSPDPAPGDAGKAEIARRYGTPSPSTSVSSTGRGSAGRAAAATRYGKKGK